MLLLCHSIVNKRHCDTIILQRRIRCLNFVCSSVFFFFFSNKKLIDKDIIISKKIHDIYYFSRINSYFNKRKKFIQDTYNVCEF